MDLVTLLCVVSMTWYFLIRNNLSVTLKLKHNVLSIPKKDVLVITIIFDLLY